MEDISLDIARYVMIDRYKGENGKIQIIKNMDDSHVLNAYRYFALKRKEMNESNLSSKFTTKYDGKDLFEISLLINSLLQEIDKRELLKY